MFDAPRLTRTFPEVPIEFERLAQFHWLVVEEEVKLDLSPEARASPFMSMDLRRDLGEIEPHLGKFPSAVEDALFFLLLAPWEEWSTMQEVDWRGFRIPWVYTINNDLFVRPAQPPSVSGLTVEPWIVQDEWGEDLELERPSCLPLDDVAQSELQRFDETAWTGVQAARATSLFDTPVVHFLVRAFLSDGIDEVMAHMTAIEAALGLEMDHRTSLRPKPDFHRTQSATNRVAARVGAALKDAQAAQDYKALFELRSGFVHDGPD